MPSWINEISASPQAQVLARVLLIIALTIIALRGLKLLTSQMDKRIERTIPNEERQQRLKTLANGGYSVGYAIFLLIATLMVLHAVGIDITPLLASAGVAGLALSLGAQTLIKDFIGGVLILVEDQFSVGDVIAVGEVSGVVERITLRTTHLRNLEGRLHIVPNGDVRLVSNLTAEWARAVINLNVDFDADMSSVMRALNEAAQNANNDDAVKADLLEDPQAVGWVGSTDWAMQVRILAKVRPGRQWAVSMALRRLAVEALQREGVRLALPRQKFETLDK